MISVSCHLLSFNMICRFDDVISYIFIISYSMWPLGPARLLRVDRVCLVHSVFCVAAFAQQKRTRLTTGTSNSYVPISEIEIVSGSLQSYWFVVSVWLMLFDSGFRHVPYEYWWLPIIHVYCSRLGIYVDFTVGLSCVLAFYDDVLFVFLKLYVESQITRNKFDVFQYVLLDPWVRSTWTINSALMF